jgi:hypothetical protein
MDSRSLLVKLETPYEKYDAAFAPARDVVIAGLCYSTSEYWSQLAISWLDEGATIDAEIVALLDEIADRKHFSQKVRQRAFALSRRWNREHGNA